MLRHQHETRDYPARWVEDLFGVGDLFLRTGSEICSNSHDLEKNAPSRLLLAGEHVPLVIAIFLCPLPLPFLSLLEPRIFLTSLWFLAVALCLCLLRPFLSPSRRSWLPLIRKTSRLQCQRRLVPLLPLMLLQV